MTNKDIFKELGNIDEDLILDAAPRERIRFPRRLMALAASLVLVFCILWAVGFENVYAGVRELFSFIPGVGIQETQGTVYAWKPGTARLEAGNMTAQILRASYAAGRLDITVEVNGKSLWSEQFRFFINGEPRELRQGDDHYYSLATSNDASMLDFSIPMAQPQSTDRFEIEINGFQGRLAFTLTPCETYEQLEQIGPTVTKNGISLTATAHRNGNELVVWCYDTRWSTAIQDELVGIGSPVNSGHSILHYIETESGHIQSTSSGWILRNRMVFQLGDGDKTATLHIPYLAMYRQEKGKLKLTLPETASAPGTVLETSLGNIRVVSVERSPYQDGKDNISIRLAYDNTGELNQMYSLNYRIRGGITDYFTVDTNDGTVTLLNVIVDKNQKSLDLSISGIYYYLTEEYVIPLEIAE